MERTPDSVTNFDMRRYNTTLSVIVLAAVSASAESPADEPVTLRVKPVLCITDKRNEHCEMSFIVQWESEYAGDFCLHNDFSDGPLDCWLERSSGRFDEDRVVVSNFSYWISVPHGETRLAEAEIEVMSTDSADRRRNRRSRHAWSIL